MEINGLSQSYFLSKFIKKIDSDKNGSLSSDEFATLNANTTISADALSQIFAKTDVNGDGEITETELGDAISQSLQEKFSQYFTADIQTQLVSAIENNDTTTAESIISSIAKAMNSTYSHMPMRGHGGERPPPPDKMFDTMDTDSSGTVTLEEFIEMGKKIGKTDSEESENIFSRIDTDGDGVITLDELKADFEKMKESHDENMQAHGIDTGKFIDVLMNMMQRSNSSTSISVSEQDISGLLIDKYA